MYGLRQDELAGALGQATLLVEGIVPFVAVQSGGAYGGRRHRSRRACGEVSG